MKIKRLKIVDHKILKNLEINFNNQQESIVDTVIIAGENGCGKSSLLEFIYTSIYHQRRNFLGQISPPMDVVPGCEMEVEIEGSVKVCVVPDKGTGFYYRENKKLIGPIAPFIIFSDSNTDLRTKKAVTGVTATDLDLPAYMPMYNPNEDFVQRIQQLFVDIAAADAVDVAEQIEELKARGENDLKNIKENQRMGRFKKAFDSMFKENGLRYESIKNVDGRKVIFFNKNGSSIPLDDLSSGEKQIIYRGATLLRNKGSMKGAIVLIDEPEISLHPKWQLKIMDYYKNIFTDEHGIQTSQIFFVTHSPFIIHNKNRNNDKVIILTRNADGDIEVSAKKEFYSVGDPEAIEDAFDIDMFKTQTPVVYLEGKTDEQYFNKALDVFGYDKGNLGFEFKSIAVENDNGSDSGGQDSMKRLLKLHEKKILSDKVAFLFDCDVKNITEATGSSIKIKKLKERSNDREIKKGIENSLILETSLNLEDYEKVNETPTGDGFIKKIPELKKMALCDHICGLDDERVKRILFNLKEEIDELIDFFKT